MRRQRLEEHRKQQIRAAATRCFVRRGYAATRLLDIAREAGLSKGGVYFHYRAKEALFHDIFEVQIEVLKQRWGFEPVADQPADRTLVQVLVAHLRELEARPDETRLCNQLVTLAVQETGFQGKLDEVLAVTRGLYAGVIRRGIDEGVFPPGDPTELAGGIVAMIQGMAALSAADPDGRLPLAPDVVAGLALRLLGGPEAAAARAAGDPVAEGGVSASFSDPGAIAEAPSEGVAPSPTPPGPVETARARDTPRASGDPTIDHPPASPP